MQTECTFSGLGISNGATEASLLLPETDSLFNSPGEFLLQILVVLVWWEIQAVETVWSCQNANISKKLRKHTKCVIWADE